MKVQMAGPIIVVPDVPQEFETHNPSVRGAIALFGSQDAFEIFAKKLDPAPRHQVLERAAYLPQFLEKLGSGRMVAIHPRPWDMDASSIVLPAETLLASFEPKGDGHPVHVHLGGDDLDRVYMRDDAFAHPNGVFVSVWKSRRAGVPIPMPDEFALHRARYAFVASLCQPNDRILDFPCGSGYGLEVITSLVDVLYEGRDIEPLTLEHARRTYRERGTFRYGNLAAWDWTGSFDLIACIEGIEFIDPQYQGPLLEAFRNALKPDGVLILSCSDEPRPGRTSSFTRRSLSQFLPRHFGLADVRFFKRQVTQGEASIRCLYACCRKEAMVDAAPGYAEDAVAPGASPRELLV